MTVTRPALPSVAEHLEGLRAAMVAFVRYADRAGLEAAVPTTPDWTVRRLVAHQGMVHRWAAASLRGERVDPDPWEREGRQSADPMEWLRDGAIEVVQTIMDAPADRDALVFLADAPPPREFWARRQCHETTVHAVDALSAALGRHPHAADTWIDPTLALDGVDELLTGFLPRPRSRLRAEEPLTVVVVPDDSDRSWVVEVGPHRPVTTRHTGPVTGDVLLTGSSVALYLTLWNRSDEITPDDTSWELWRDLSQVRWA